MADIAVIFHWPPSELCSLSLTELITWREKALQRRGFTEKSPGTAYRPVTGV
ncbi:GpE family phage tail protein [Salmonella enterica subsp. enterica serovar Bareilly]